MGETDMGKTSIPAMYWIRQLSEILKAWVVAAPIIFLTLLNIVWRFASKKYVRNLKEISCQFLPNSI